jgi:hypothetical protein
MNINNLIESVNADPKRFLFIFLAIIPTIIYLGWIIKQLTTTILSNKKGGEYK